MKYNNKIIAIKLLFQMNIYKIISKLLTKILMELLLNN